MAFTFFIWINQKKQDLSNLYLFIMILYMTGGGCTDALNEVSVESERFMNFLVNALKDEWNPSDNRLKRKYP